MNESAKPHSGLVINLHENKEGVTVSITNGSSLMLDAKSISELIQLLSRIRCQMEPRTPESLLARPIQMLSDSTSQLVIDRDPQNVDLTVIGVFHPGPGWIGLSLDKNAASKIRDLLEYMAKLVPTH